MAGVAQTPTADQADRFFNCAEFLLPQSFPERGAARSVPALLYRHCPATGTYVGVHEDGPVYVMGGAFSDQPLRVGAVADFIAAPLPVKPTSPANAKAIDLAPRVLPAIGEGRYGGARYWDTRAFADFEQSGRYSYFAMSMSYLLEQPDERDQIYLWHLNDDGSYTDISARIFEGDRTACIRGGKAVVADFNADGRPDIFLSCIGQDWAPYPGETPNLVLSQPNGHYRLVPVPLGQPAFIHSAAAADINGDGLPDIVITDSKSYNRSNFPVSVLINKGAGRFHQDTSNFKILPWDSVFQVELLDVDGDGRIDLWMSGWDNSAFDYPSSIHALVGPGRFAGKPKLVLPSLAAGAWDMIYDITVDQGSLYVVRTTGRFEGAAIQRVDLASNRPRWSTSAPMPCAIRPGPTARG